MLVDLAMPRLKDVDLFAIAEATAKTYPPAVVKAQPKAPKDGSSTLRRRRRRAMWPWIAAAFALGVSVGGLVMVFARLGSDRLLRSLASFVDVEPAPVRPSPRAAAAVAVAHIGRPPSLPTAPPRSAASPPLPPIPKSVRWQPSATNTRWQDGDEAPKPKPRSMIAPRRSAVR
jgi:hypothetical protein